MRLLAAFTAGSLLVLTAAYASGSFTTGNEDVAPAAPIAPALATADPEDASRTDTAVEHGRLASADRTARRGPLTLRGFALPIPGVPPPTDPDLLPNAPRAYRAGFHEGIDFVAKAGTPVHAIADGVIVRIDHEFSDWDVATRDAALRDALRLRYTPADTLDRIRGRQVWVDHGRGIVSRYAHLSAVAERYAVGDVVAVGDVIGSVGSSGLPEGGPHLHLELRIGSSYLGDGLRGDDLIAAVAAAFE